MKILKLVPIVTVIAMFTSCYTPKNMTYLKDAERGTVETIQQTFDSEQRHSDDIGRK